MPARSREHLAARDDRNPLSHALKCIDEGMFSYGSTSKMCCWSFPTPKKRKNKKEASPLPYDPPTHQIKKERQQQEQKTTSLWTPSSGWFLLNLF